MTAEEEEEMVRFWIYFEELTGGPHMDVRQKGNSRETLKLVV